MKVSVLLTVYNLERYLEAAVRSVLAQTYTDLEIVVVDDASTDHSVARLAPFADRIVLLRNRKNLGVLRATLRALEYASGDVYCFLDGDDLWEPEKVARVVAALKIAPHALVSHDLSFIDSEGRRIIKRSLERLRPQSPGRRVAVEAVDQTMRRSILGYEGRVWLGSALSLHAAALDRPEFARWVATLANPALVYQDHPLATFVALTSRESFGYIDEPLLRYRVHRASYSGGARDLDSAQKIVRQGHATRLATADLVRRYAAASNPFVERQAHKLGEYAFLDALYAGRTRVALGAFARCCQTTWTRRQIARESLRLGAVLALGRCGYFALRSRLRPGGAEA